MSGFDKNENGQGDLPNMEREGSLADALNESRQDFRAREKAAAAATASAENEGLPSVNRRKKGNKLVTALGFLFILGAAAALIVAVNGPNKPKVKTAAVQDQVANNLPPITIPAPPPITTPASTPAPATAPTAAKPIPLQQGGTRYANTGNVKVPPTPMERKMGGSLLIGSTPGLDGAAPAPAAVAVPAGEVVRPGPGMPGLGGSSNNELGAKLEPTVTVAASASMLPDRNFLITKGTPLDCVLETAFDSTLAGLTTCHLTRDVYSDNGQVLLLDRGTKLVGEYQGGIKQGMARVFVLWTRAETPNGVVVNLNSPTSDALGRAGMDGYVEEHFIKRFGAAILMSIVSAWAQGLSQNNGSSNGTTNYYGAGATGGAQVVDKILETSANIPPTLLKNQGEHIQVMVARDLDFSNVYSLRTAQ